MLGVALTSGALLGLASIPHCVAMCGPLASYACLNGRRAAALHYQLGRIAAYGALGLGAGATGAAITYPLSAWGAAALSWALAAALLLAAARILIGSRRHTQTVALGTRPPSRWTRLARRVAGRPALLGVATGALPCAALWSAAAVAATTGSATQGAVVMLGFGVTSAAGTVLGSLLARLPRRAGRWITAGVLVAGAGLLVARPMIPAPDEGGSTPSCHAQLH